MKVMLCSHLATNTRDNESRPFDNKRDILGLASAGLNAV
jgi:hypothetical protein